MKILFYRYGSICEPDIISGFQELGVTISQITEEMTNKKLTWKESTDLVSHYLLDHPHDCVFTINFFPHISEICNIFKIPYICWIVDSPVMELFTKSIQNPCNRIFLFDKEQYREIEPLNPGHVFHFPLAVNVKQKQQAIQNSTQKERLHFSSDISFVGSLYTEKSPYDKLKNPPDYLAGYLNGIMEAQLKIYGYFLVEEVLPESIIAQFKAHMPNFYQSPLDNYLSDRKIVSQLYIGNKITAIERIRTMESLSEHFAVDLYTGSDTSKLPKVHNRGLVKTLTEMPIVFHESKINLNTTSKAIRSGIPLRVFDIFACEGFMLSNYQNELMEYFEAGTDFDYYSSMEELIDKTDYYLNHEKQRKEIAHNAYEKVSHYYNYPLRLCELMELTYSVK